MRSTIMMFFFFNDTATTEIYTLSLHDALPISVPHPELAGIHFTGSTATFQHLWQAVARGLPSYRSYPRLVGETGGEDFLLAHPPARVAPPAIAPLRGAFREQGEKSSGAWRAYGPRPPWAGGPRAPRRGRGR